MLTNVREMQYHHETVNDGSDGLGLVRIEYSNANKVLLMMS